MAASKSRSRRALEMGLIGREPGLRLGPTEQKPAVLSQSPEQAMRESNPHHIVSLQGILSGTEGGTGSSNVTVPNASTQQTSVPGASTTPSPLDANNPLNSAVSGTTTAPADPSLTNTAAQAAEAARKRLKQGVDYAKKVGIGKLVSSYLGGS